VRALRLIEPASAASGPCSSILWLAPTNLPFTYGVASIETVGRLREAFHHPSQGFVDALVMYRSLL